MLINYFVDHQNNNNLSYTSLYQNVNKIANKRTTLKYQSNYRKAVSLKIEDTITQNYQINQHRINIKVINSSWPLRLVMPVQCNLTLMWADIVCWVEWLRELSSTLERLWSDTFWVVLEAGHRLQANDGGQLILARHVLGSDDPHGVGGSTSWLPPGQQDNRVLRLDQAPLYSHGDGLPDPPVHISGPLVHLGCIIVDGEDPPVEVALPGSLGIASHGQHGAAWTVGSH